MSDESSPAVSGPQAGSRARRPGEKVRRLSTSKKKLRRTCWLPAQTQVGNELYVAIVLCSRQIVQQSAPAANHLQQTATRVIVVLVCTQVLGQRIDAVGKQGDL